MEPTQAAVNRLSARTKAEIVALWAAHGNTRRFRVAAAALVASANTAGVQLADLGLAAEITRVLRRPAPPLGLVPNAVQVDQDRMARDIDRIIQRAEQGDFDPGGDLGDWGASETHLTVANTVQAAMAQRGIERWVRVLSGTSCPLCTGWADGIPRSVNVPMARHVGCDCIQQPVL